MRIKCVNEGSQITENSVYHVMKEDDVHYYVVDDSGVISMHDKEDFAVVGAGIQFRQLSYIFMPNGETFTIERGNEFRLQGRYHCAKDDGTIETMCVFKIGDSTPVAISESYVRFVEM